MSTHIPADYFTKPILARLGVGKSHGCNGWILGAPQVVRFEWVTPVNWDHDGIDGASRAFCGAEAPTGDRILRVEGPAPFIPGPEFDWSHNHQPFGRAIPRRLITSDNHPILEARFPGEKSIGYVQIEKHDEHRARVLDTVVRAVGTTAAREEWIRWQSENEDKLRVRVVLYLPRRVEPCTCRGDFSDGMIRHAGDCKADAPGAPDFAAIDCPRCLAAWDVFAADTGATVEVIPPVEQDDDPDLRESYGNGGRW